MSCYAHGGSKLTTYSQFKRKYGHVLCTYNINNIYRQMLKLKLKLVDMV